MLPLQAGLRDSPGASSVTVAALSWAIDATHNITAPISVLKSCFVNDPAHLNDGDHCSQPARQGCRS